MIREEAIKILQKIKPVPYRGDCKSTTHLLETMAFDMAIEALKAESCEMRDATEQERKSIDDYVKSISRPTGFNVFNESCEDCVSREAALKALAELPHEYKTKEQRARTGGIAACQTIVRELPPITPKPRWIPVDYDSYPETYPKAFQEVWITDAYGEVYHKAYDGTRSIKAWMSYDSPEPYEEGESE